LRLGVTPRWTRRPPPACMTRTRSCAGSGTWWTSSLCWNSPPPSSPSTVSPRPRSPTGTATSWSMSFRTSTRFRSCCSTPGRPAELVASGVLASKMAVLVRVNVQTERFEQALTQAGVPFQVRGTERFFGRAEVRQAMGMLRAAAAAPATAAAPAAAEVRHVLSGLGLAVKPPPGRGSARERWESLAALARLADDFCAITPGAGLAEVVAGLAHRAAIELPPAPAGVTV